MFIVYTKDNTQYIENSDYKNREFTWEDIPKDVRITALILTHPISLMINNKRVSPKVSIKKYHYYYFFNEAIINVIQNNEGGLEQKEANLVAKVIAGVDVEKKYVLETRLDKFGNTSISSYPLEILIKKFDNGQMKKSILRPGLDCPIGKNLL